MAEYTAETALIVVDVQNDFADPGGNLYVRGGEEVVEAANREIAKAQRGGALVVYTQDWHPEQTPHFQDHGGVWPRHCVQGTEGAELHPNLEVEGPVVQKGTEGEDGYSGFSVRDPETGEEGATELDGILRERGIDRVVIVGLAQDVCVHETAKDAVGKGYDTELLVDVTRPVDPDAAQERLDELKDLGVHLS
ncbi:MAG: isochorismatase family protein [Actinobacteria bacterium]|nr:isochorismatase family protein [Actinomycetota bacterium]